jgi:phosphopantetheine adenylyltransferase
MIHRQLLEKTIYTGNNQYIGLTSHIIYKPSIKPKNTPNLNEITELYYTWDQGHFGLYEVRLIQ